MKKKVKCRDFFECNERECPVYEKKEFRCWLVPGTHCRNEIQGKFLEKMEMCLECEPFRANMDVDSMEKTIKLLNEQFTQFRRIVDERDRELEGVGMELALGLSEVFEALIEISSGDPEVRIPETSQLELITKLKHMVNLTAENQAEIVNLSHEFAIGLAEHFGVLHRVSEGDLGARVSGVSQLELLESLKEVTNKMIESVSTEITERKRAEEKLKESEEKYRTQFEKTLDAMFVADAETGILIDCNQAGAELVGRAKSELVGKHQRILHPPEEVEGEFSRTFKEHLKEKEGQPLEAQVITKNGEIRDVSIKANMLELKGRKILQGAFRDVTEKKRAEKEKRKLEAQLQRAEKMEVVGTLAGGVAHDLNNILGGLVSVPELLLMELPEDSPLRDPILAIENSGKKAAAIVQDLLTLARRGVTTTEVSNLNDVVTDYLRSREYERLKSFHPGVKIETSLETNLLNVLGSPTHLSKTVMNLISNAAEALPNGGKITISTKNQYIDREIAGYDDVREGDYVVLSVADNGMGIALQDQQRIFEPFYTKKVMGRSGTGLGMAVVWGTVKDHNGYIELKSTEGKGTTFDLYYPVTRKEAEKEKAPTSIQEYMGHGQTILVVDDVQEQREIASMLLTKLGYSVHTVSSGEEAVEYVKTNSTDLLVLDMIMDPGIDGLDTYTKILELHPGMKAVIASGFSETDRVKEAQTLGAGQYVKKPYTLEKIGLALKTELAK